MPQFVSIGSLRLRIPGRDMAAQAGSGARRKGDENQGSPRGVLSRLARLLTGGSKMDIFFLLCGKMKRYIQEPLEGGTVCAN